MRAVLVLSVCLIALVIPPSGGAAGTDATLPAWLQAHLDARGIDADAADLRVVRTVTSGGASTSFEVPLAALMQDDPFAGRDVAPPGVPEVLAGDLTLHIMFQSDCAGYGVQEVAPGISSIQDATWPVGMHIALGPLAGGAAVGTGSDPTALPTNAVVIAGMDAGIAIAAGELTTSYDRLELFGSCLLGIGLMTGTGAWVFS